MAPPRKTHCIRGHLYTAKTERIDPRGGRSCKICARARFLTPPVQAYQAAYRAGRREEQRAYMRAYHARMRGSQYGLERD